MYHCIIIHLVRWSPGSMALPCRRRVGFRRGVRGCSLTSRFCPAARSAISATVVGSSLVARLALSPAARLQCDQPVNSAHRPDAASCVARLLQRIQMGLTCGQPFTLQQFTEILQVRNPDGVPNVLIGGQAINYWAGYYLAAKVTYRGFLKSPFLLMQPAHLLRPETFRSWRQSASGRTLIRSSKA